jgi:ketosteroid isomerase-like protein
MNGETKRAIVEKAYADFGRGDIPAILASLAPDVEWHDSGAPYVPYAGTYRGHRGVGQFFSKMGEAIEMLELEPRGYVEQGDKVVAWGRFKARSRSTERVYETDWAMVWSFAGDKVARFQAYVDTAAVAAAFQA